MTVGAAPPSLPVLTAVTGRWESLLVSGLERERARVEVVRRCADLADLLATAATGQARAVVLSADLRQLDGEALRLLRADRCAVVALVEPGDEPAERRLRQLGVAQVLPADATAGVVATALQAAVDELSPPTSDQRVDQVGGGARVSADTRDSSRDLVGGTATSKHVDAANGQGAAAAGAAMASSEVTGPTAAVTERAAAAATEGGAPGAGSDGVVVVWGPAGAPGRTTTAVSLAAELAGAGASTLLVDADTYAASVGQVLGLLDEAPGLASAARAADHGTLDVHQLSRLAPQVLPNLRVLTGIARSHRWPELRPAAVGTVLRLARSLTRFTVVDTGFCLEQDEELSYDTAAPRRNGATLAAIEQADTLIAVGAGDPIGLQRLVRSLQDLAELTSRRPLVVVTRVRAATVGASPERRVREALERYAGVTDVVLVPNDPAALDAALLVGRTLAEVAPASTARHAYLELAERLITPGATAPSRARPGRSRRVAS